MENFKIKVDVPVDQDGYALLQCQHCGEFFKISASDAKDDRILKIYCPCCGLTSDTYVTDEVIALAEVKIQNRYDMAIYDELKKLERSTKNSFIKFKAGPKPRLRYEEPLYSKIDTTEEVYFECCKRFAKIKPLLKTTGCYCPFCGVKEYEPK